MLLEQVLLSEHKYYLTEVVTELKFYSAIFSLSLSLPRSLGMSVKVLYHFQNELGESESIPNAVMLPNSFTGPLTFGQFCSSFFQSVKIDSESLHFRFRRDDKDRGYVWQDMANADDLVPVKGGDLIAKILRVDSQSTINRVKRLRLKKRIDSGASLLLSSNSKTVLSQQPKAHLSSSSSSTSSSSSSTSSSSLSSSSSVTISHPQTSIKRGSSSNLQSAEGINNLLDDSDDNQQRSISNDLFHFDESDKTEDFTIRATTDVDIEIDNSSSSKGLSREELVARRESLVQEKVAAALEFKQEVRSYMWQFQLTTNYVNPPLLPIIIFPIAR